MINLTRLNNIHRLWRVAAVLVWAAFIFYLSSIPGLSTHLGIWDFILRKAAHMAEYAILAGLIFWSFGKKEKLYFIISALLALLYAASDEFHQSFVANRTAAPHDVLIDSIGIIIAILLVWHFIKNKKISVDAPVSVPNEKG